MRDRVRMTEVCKFVKLVAGKPLLVNESPLRIAADHLASVLGVEMKRNPRKFLELHAEQFYALLHGATVSPAPFVQKPVKQKSVEKAESDKFLASYKWRVLRMKALTLHGPVCMCCGATKETGAIMNVDHIKPRKLRPDLSLDIRNLQILCDACNHGKSNWDQTDWRTDSQKHAADQAHEGQ